MHFVEGLPGRPDHGCGHNPWRPRRRCLRAVWAAWFDHGDVAPGTVALADALADADGAKAAAVVQGEAGSGLGKHPGSDGPDPGGRREAVRGRSAGCSLPRRISSVVRSPLGGHRPGRPPRSAARTRARGEPRYCTPGSALAARRSCPHLDPRALIRHLVNGERCQARKHPTHKLIDITHGSSWLTLTLRYHRKCDRAGRWTPHPTLTAHVAIRLGARCDRAIRACQ